VSEPKKMDNDRFERIKAWLAERLPISEDEVGGHLAAVAAAIAESKGDVSKWGTLAGAQKHAIDALEKELADVKAECVRLRCDRADSERATDTWIDVAAVFEAASRTMSDECDDLDRQLHELRKEMDAAKTERLALARIYDPNCDEYDYETQLQAMEGARRTVEAMQELAGAMAMDPEGCLTDVPDKVLGELEAAKEEAARLRELYLHALKQVDRIFQPCREHPEPILPGFCKLGEDKFKAVVRVAERYASMMENQRYRPKT